MRGRALKRVRGALTGLMVAALVAPAVALAFPPDVPPPGSGPEGNPSESVRVNTPDDPAFDRCEPDDEQGSSCTNVFDELYERFGFAPESTDDTARYFNTSDPHVQRLQQQNTQAGPRPQRPGLRRVRGPGLEAHDRRSRRLGRGHPRHRHPLGSEPLRSKVRLNASELPRPQGAPARRRRRRLVRVDDYAGDPGVNEAAGEDERPTATSTAGPDRAPSPTASTTTATATWTTSPGWDFFDDDNNS